MPTVKEGDIKDKKLIEMDRPEPHTVYKAEVEGFGKVFYKEAFAGNGPEDQYELLGNEVESYRMTVGKSVGPEFLAIIVDDKKKPVGFLAKLIKGASEPGRGDLDKCVEKLEAFHEAGLLYGNDLKRDQFVKDKDGDIWLIDYEYAQASNDKAQMKREVAKLRKVF
ncbi:Uu.00g090250.m01.CDS01 [Anthostomella pinea]|uniref:Uu.00g090250.m01.CDS01 n=1 Tax=Anthostomella pinea TaxID=933095 RepID=A0AAI8VMU6_9PEZI|nr:Uu.00g090250.m01.CDS01 [Anthostomella pinea]